jgi:hypothetical protein
LEGQENRTPTIQLWLMEDEAAVGPGAVIMPVFVAIALVHVYVVDPISRRKSKHLVRRRGLWTPTRAIGVETVFCARQQAIDTKVELIDEVIARSKTGRRDASHVASVKHAASLVVQGQSAGTRLDGVNAVGNAA